MGKNKFVADKYLPTLIYIKRKKFKMRFLRRVHGNINLLDQIFLNIFLKQSLLKLYKFVLKL